MIGEFDLQIVHALQEAPRAPWSVVAAVLGSDPRTVSRRYDLLVTEGKLRVMATPGHRMLGRITWAVLRAQTRPGQAETVARRLARWPHAPTVRVTDGAFGVYALLSGGDTRSLWRAAQAQLATIPQIIGAQVHTVIESLDVGRAQRLDSLSRAQVTELRAFQRRVAGPKDREPSQFSADDAELVALLTADGRMEIAAMAHAAGRVASSVSRRVARLQAEGYVDFVAMTTDSFSSRPVTALIWCTVAAGELAALSTKLAPLAWVGLLTITTGRSNVFLVAHLTNAAAMADVITEFSEICPSLQVDETQLSMQAVKVHTRVMDREERWTDEVVQPYYPFARIHTDVITKPDPSLI